MSYTYSNYTGPSFADLVHLSPVAKLSATIASLSLDNCEEYLPHILSTLQEYNAAPSTEGNHISVHVAQTLQQLTNMIAGEGVDPTFREVYAIPLLCTPTGFLPSPVGVRSKIPLSGTLYELVELSKKPISDTIHLFDYSSEHHETLLQIIKQHLLDPALPLAEVYIRPVVTPAAISGMAYNILRRIVDTLQELMSVCFSTAALKANYSYPTYVLTSGYPTAAGASASISPYHI